MAKLYLLNGNKYLIIIPEREDKQNNMTTMRAAIFEVNGNKLINSVKYETKTETAYTPEIALNNMQITAALSVVPMGGCDYLINELKSLLYAWITKQRSGKENIPISVPDKDEKIETFLVQKISDNEYKVYTRGDDNNYSSLFQTLHSADAVLDLLARHSLAFDGIMFAFKKK